MLAGPPRVLTLVTLAIVIVLGTYYINLRREAHLEITFGSPRIPTSANKGTGVKPDGVDFSIPLRFKDGVAKPEGEKYSKVIVVGKTKDEDLGWMDGDEELQEWKRVVYEVDNPQAENKIPMNKGREAMVYLTYLIDHYNDLPDIVLFMHPHQRAWHNNQLMGLNSAQMLKRLNHDRVARQGYMNIRCHHDPGCPDWIHMDRPGGDFDFFHKPEEIHFRRHVWEEIHPGAPIPQSLSGICCAQFAVSRDRIRQVPLERFIHYRNWLIETTMDDQYSGRVFEYIWHYIFTGHEVYCPAMNTCYCDGYGFCFGGQAKFHEFFDKQEKRITLQGELNPFKKQEEEARKKGEEEPDFTMEQKKRIAFLQKEIGRLNEEMNEARRLALERGKDPLKRLEETEQWDLGEEIWEYLPGKSKGPPKKGS